MLEPQKVNPTHYDGDACMQKIARVCRACRGDIAACFTLAIKHLWRAGTKQGESFQTDVGKSKWYVTFLNENVAKVLDLTPYERSVLAILCLAADQDDPARTRQIVRDLREPTAEQWR